VSTQRDVGRHLYYVSWLDEEWVPVAEGDDDPQRDALLASSDPVVDWRTPVLRLTSAEVLDYLPNNIGVRLCSPHMRGVIDGAISDEDEIQWLPAVVNVPSGPRQPYFVLHLPGELDILDNEKSIWVDGFVVKPVFDLGKVRERSLIRPPAAELTLIVSDRMRIALLAAACSGLAFERASTS
jgi:hypothetical protein